MFIETFKVRFYETDALAHVSNTVLAGWFESAREPIFKIFTPNLDLQNWPLILASYNIDFLQQIYYGKEVELKTYVERIGTSSFSTYQELWQNGKKAAKGTTTMVHFDYKVSQSKPITDAQKALLSEHLLEKHK